MQSHRQPWFQFRLRKLLFVVFLVGSFCWFGVTMYKAGKQREAREILRVRHWTVLHEFWHNSDLQLVSPKPAGPALLRTMLGEDFFNDVTWVKTPVPEHIAPLDADFDYLASFPRLRRLEVGGHATDSVLARLQGMQHLEWLELDDGTITDAGLRSLERLSSLRFLHLSGTPISDDGLIHLAGLRQLRTLDLSETRITDAGLQQLADLRQLRRLRLSNTAITDAGLEHLKGLASGELTSMSLYDTQVTDQGVRDFQKSAPNCRIYR